jgi:hypothetical protein
MEYEPLHWLKEGGRRARILMRANPMDEPTIDVLCENCGQTFTAFLKEMADKNAEVTCPACGKNCGSGNAKPAPERN